MLAPIPTPAIPAQAVLETAPAPPQARRAVYGDQRTLAPLTPWYVNTGMVPVQRGQVIYMEVGPETARQFGLALAGPIQAEVFVGDDGMARAIRLVRTQQIVKGE